MAESVQAYLSSAPSVRLDDPSSVKRWLSSVESHGLAALGSLSDSLRTKFCKALIGDLAKATGQRHGDITLNHRSAAKWDAELRLVALRVLKEMSRLPGGSRPLADKEGLECLLLQIDFPVRQRSGLRQDQASTDSSSSADSKPSTSSLSSSPSFANTIARALRRPSTPSFARRGSEGTVRANRAKESSERDGTPGNATPKVAGKAPDWDVTDMALRCLNNALFLHETCRAVFASDEVGGGHAAIALLSKPRITPVDILFLGSRLLFFCTIFESPFNTTAVETLNGIAVEAECTYALTHAIVEAAAEDPAEKQSTLQSSGKLVQFNAALSDLLKAHFNICLYYPRLANRSATKSVESGSAVSDNSSEQQAIAGEGYHKALDAMLDPILGVITALPLGSPAPLSPPTTHAIAALLNYPIVGYRDRWASQSGSLASQEHPSSPVSFFPPSSSNAARKLADSVSNLFSNGNSGSASRRGSKTLSSDTLPPSSPSRRPSRVAISSNRFEVDISAMSAAALDDAPPVLAKLLRIADKVLERYLSAGNNEDPDDKAVKAAAMRDGVDLEDTVQPLLLLLRKIAAEDEEMKRTMRAILLPKDMDRSQSVDKRLDLTGRLVRLMSSVLLPRLARAAGEALLATCDLDPKTMTEEIGYGPCAGFLMNVGLASALPSGHRDGNSAEGGRTINPITGQYDPTPEELADDEFSKLTEEEKEIEAEKLLVLFDRLNKTGVVKVDHPAMNAGRFEEVDDGTDQQRQEEEDEAIVEREMAERKKRQAEAKVRAQALVAKTPAGEE